jgi:DNA-binding transcriptional LysR family regulator
MRDLDQLKEELTGDLKISTSLICGEFILPAILSGFSKKYQSVGIRLVISDTSKVWDDLKQGIFAIGFAGIAPDNLGNEFEFFKIATDELVLAVSLGHKLAQQDEVLLEDLVGETFIVREDPWEVQRIWSQMLQEAGFDFSQFKSKIVTGTNGGVISAVQAGAGIALISDTTVKLHEALGLIKVLKIKGLKLQRNFFCIYNKEARNARITGQFINYMYDAVHQNPIP